MTPRKFLAASALSAFFILISTASLWAQSQDAVAVITELKLNRGDVQVRLPGKNNSERAGVLQSLAPGARLTATKDAVAVVLFTDGSKTVTVNEKNSPFDVAAVPAKSQGNPLGQVASLLLGKKPPPTYTALATRGAKKPPTLLSPRNTKLLSETPTLQWMGMEQQPGTVRLYSPEGPIWSAENIALTQIKLPANAAPLRPGVEYTWSLEKKGFPPEKANFKILRAEEAKEIQGRLASLQQASGASPTTLAILKSAFLISNELYHDAREVLTEAVKSDPDEPTLHFLLGDVYDKTGLKNLAADEYGEADFLGKGRAK